jgi:hypothetical protein
LFSTTIEFPAVISELSVALAPRWNTGCAHTSRDPFTVLARL